MATTISGAMKERQRGGDRMRHVLSMEEATVRAEARALRLRLGTASIYTPISLDRDGVVRFAHVAQARRGPGPSRPRSERVGRSTPVGEAGATMRRDEHSP